jgi:hypothetical protein
MTNKSIPSRQQILDEITAARDQARLSLHLLSMDARTAWNDVERRLLELQGLLEKEGGQLSESVVSSAGQLTRSAREILTRPAASRTHR